MVEHKIATREEWQAARDELAKLEAEQAERNEEIKRKRLELPWVPVEKEYEFDTEDGKKTLAELFDGRSQLLAYNIMFGPDYTLGACPGCTSLADGLDGSLVHLNHRDVTLLCFSRAPIDRLTAYKQRMGWEFPYVSTYDTDFAFDFGLALTEEQAQQRPRDQGDDREPARVAPGVVGPDRGRAEGRAAREPELDRLRARERHRLPHLHRVGARSVRRAVLQLPARANTETATRRAPLLAEGRVPGLTSTRDCPGLPRGYVAFFELLLGRPDSVGLLTPYCRGFAQPIRLSAAYEGLLFFRPIPLERSAGHVPSISTSSVKLSRIRVSTMTPSTVTLSNVGSTTMVRMMSATMRTSRPSRMHRPRLRRCSRSYDPCFVTSPAASRRKATKEAKPPITMIPAPHPALDPLDEVGDDLVVAHELVSAG